VNQSKIAKAKAKNVAVKKAKKPAKEKYLRAAPY
jgi:hypothetical protein